MNRTYQRPYKATFFSSAQKMYGRDMANAHLDTVVLQGLPKGMQRPFKYSFYKEDGPGGAPCVITSGTIRLFGGSASEEVGSGSKIAIALHDHQPNEQTVWATSGVWRVQVNIDNPPISKGMTAYYIAETGLFTASPIGGGTTRIQVGNFTSGVSLAPELGMTSGTFWALVQLNQDSNNPSIAAPTVLSCTCDEACDIVIMPTVTAQTGLAVDFAANAWSGNPEIPVGAIEWNFSGNQTGGLYNVEATGENVSHIFPTAGTYTVRVTAFSDLSNGSPCCTPVDGTTEPCCKAYEISVVVTAQSARVISVCEVPAVVRTYQGSAQYTEAVRRDTVLGSITIAGTAYHLDPIALATNLGDAIQAIKDLLDDESIAYTDVTIVYFAAPDDFEAATVIITITGATADFQTLTVLTDGAGTAANITINPI